jgi:uncharacterized protein involved in exopolysaccharide biosynthesis
MLGTITALLFDEARRIWCYRWLALGVSASVFLAATAYVLHMPNVYDAWGQVFVNKQTPLTAATEGVSLVGNDFGSTYVVQKTLLNDDNLEAVVKLRNPNAARFGNLQMATTVSQLRSQIHVSPDQGDGFIEFHYADTDPARARQTVQLLLDQFISKNVARSRTDLDHAEDFLDEQLTSYGLTMSDSQGAIAEFRRRHPEVAYVPTAPGATMADMPQMTSAPQGPAPAAAPASPPTPRTARPSQAAARAAGLQAKLDSLRTTYTEQYPDVISTRRQLADALVEQEREEAAAAAERAAQPPPPAAEAPAPRTATFRTGPRQARAPIVAPDVAAQWIDLQRKDEVLRLAYQQLIGKREAARMSQAIYGGNASGKYQVTRMPTTPTAPYGPKRPLYLAFGALLAAAAGIGAAYLRAGMKGVLVAPRELESAFQLPVVGTVSLERAWRTRRHVEPSKRKRLPLPTTTA